jgi:uncharacterized protein YabN with tetrapyrrole methylase and pyrophosphatase domain
MDQHNKASSSLYCPVKQAMEIQYESAGVGFDWPDIAGVLAKVQEELDELDTACKDEDYEHAKDELGDLLFAAFSVARFLNTNPVYCLERTTNRFQKRFDCVKQMALQEGISLKSCSAERLDALWEMAKNLVSQ